MRIIIAAATLLALAGCGGTETSSSSSTEEAAVPAKVYAVGDTASADGVDVTITSVKATNRVTDPAAVPLAGPDETYVIVTYTLKNTGSKPIDLMSRPELELRDGDGRAYAKDELGSGVVSVMGDVAGAVNDMNPGTSAKTAAVWKVAKKDYDSATWKVVAQTDPALEFKLD